MRIREIEFYNFRCFRGHRRISFVDPLTDTVRPVTVLAGSNGSGKTTILEAIHALLMLVADPNQHADLVRDVLGSGLVVLAVEVSAADLGTPSAADVQILNIAVGRRELAPEKPADAWPNHLWRLAGRGGFADEVASDLAKDLRRMALDMQRGDHELHGGYVYFPYDRRLEIRGGGTVEPPPEERSWVFRFSSQNRWKGSLEQFWVWQNYLDLEQQASKPSVQGRHLGPFVQTVERLLGEGRKITVERGRVRVPAPWAENDRGKVLQIDQLPSGEQQVLTLFGELARRRRPGAVIAIDEVENSLHPTLQRLVMWNLHRIAREWDAQVIVATHSLEVINSVRGGAFINLDYPEDRFDLPVSQDGEETAVPTLIPTL